MTVSDYYDKLTENKTKLEKFKNNLKNIFQKDEVREILLNIKSYKYIPEDKHYAYKLNLEVRNTLKTHFPQDDQEHLIDACCYIGWTIIANNVDPNKNPITGYYNLLLSDEAINSATKAGKLNFSNKQIDFDDVIEQSFNNSSDAYKRYLMQKPSNGVAVTPSMTELQKIFSCSNFITVYNSNDNNQSKQRLAYLLNKYEDFNYSTIKKSVDSSSLSSENKKIVFAEVLPAYNFKVCNNFQATWDMFEKDYIDFDTLVTKFWNREDFDKNDQNSDQKQKNAFRNFASVYIKYLRNEATDQGNLHDSCCAMLREFYGKAKISFGGHDSTHLYTLIDNATDVGVLGIIVQFFSNLFSKGKKAFKPIQQIKQDRVISNLKPLSGILRQVAEQNRDSKQRE